MISQRWHVSSPESYRVGLFSIRHTTSFGKTGLSSGNPLSQPLWGWGEGIYAAAGPLEVSGNEKGNSQAKKRRKFPNELILRVVGCWEHAARGGTASSVGLASKEGQGLGCFTFKYPSWAIAGVTLGGERKRLLHQALSFPAPTQTFLSTGL